MSNYSIGKIQTKLKPSSGNFLLCILIFLVGCNSVPVISDSVPDDADGSGASGDTITRANFQIRTLVGNLDTPWDINIDPMGNLWVTERGGAVSIVDTSSGQSDRVGEIQGVLERGESGLMGFDFHPDYPQIPEIYFSHSYDGGGGSVKNRVVKTTITNRSIVSQMIILDDIPGSFNHNGSRVVVGPDRLLYISTGDAEGPNRAIELDNLSGKILRLELDGTPALGNPFGDEIYSFGHRNPQGLAFNSSNGFLYATEHGTGANDELNLILAGRNHGWPEVHGFCFDEDVDGLAEMQYCQENNVNEPIAVWTPTIAPSGATFYDADTIPGWSGSLLFTTLKGQALYRVITSDMEATAQVFGPLFEREFGRLRDVVVGGRGELYLATSNRDGRGSISGADRIIQVTYKP